MDVQTVLSESEARRQTRGAEAAGWHRSQVQRETSQNRGQVWRRQSWSKRWSQPEEATAMEERYEGAARRLQPTSLQHCLLGSRVRSIKSPNCFLKESLWY